MSSNKIEYVTFRGEFKHYTEKAVLFDRDVWIPKVCLSDRSCNSVEADEFQRGEEIEVEVAKWFADKEGLS